MKCLVVSTVTRRVRMCRNCFVTLLSPCRWYIVRSQLRNLLFRCVKSLLLLWKPHSWS